MKKSVLVFLISCIPFLIIAQLTFDLNGTVTKKISNKLSKGSIVNLKSIDYSEQLLRYRATIICKNKEELVDIKQLDNISFKPTNSNEFWKNQALIHDVYKNIAKNRMQYQLRKEIEEEALEYVKYTENNNLIFNDSYLESYLYALAYKIFPNRLEDSRPGILNVKILKDIDPNAFIFSNGTMFITTGLLSTINSEEELIGVMAHEISHFVLDHSIININKAEQRQKRAEFWAALATGVAVAADIYTAANSYYYTPGTISMGTAILAFSIASEIRQRMGLEYSREQESEADICAAELMKYINIDPTALSSALLKIREYNILNGNYLALTGEGTHPALRERIKSIGKPTTEFSSPEYDIKISFVNTFNAIVELNNHDLEACTRLVNRNIQSNIATEDEYLLLALVTTYMYDNESKNQEALRYINMAKSLKISPSINLSKQEAIVLIRLGKLEEAKKSLDQYLVALEKERLEANSLRVQSNVNNYLSQEHEWAVKMINKVGKM